MTTDIKVPEDLLTALRRPERILITAHARPDGDAMGSCLALAWALQDAGKDVRVFNEDGMPGFLSFMPLPSPILSSIEQLPWEPQLIVVLDCGDRARAGETLQPLLTSVPTVNIDHHLANPNFGSEANWVVPTASATGELVGLLVQEMGAVLQGALAEALYVAISMDTGNFSYGNTTPGTLRLASKLVEGGLDIAAVREKLENNWSKAKLRLWGRLMSETRILDEGRLAAALVTRELLEDVGATREDTEGFVEQLRRLSSVRVAALLREEEKDGRIQTKVSMRSSGNDNVRDVAAQFDGGGHKNAAGATLALNAEEALAAIHPHICSVWSEKK